MTNTGHYLFCKEGVTGAFLRYYGVHVEVMNARDAEQYEQSGTHTVFTSQYYNTRQRPVDEAF